MWNRTSCGRMLAALLCALLLGACGGGGKGGGGQMAPARLALSLGVEQSAQMVTVSLDAGGATGLHQLSCRVTYNPAALRYVDAQRGTLVDSRAVFFTTAKGGGYVPVAFTYHPGEQIPAARGSVATLTFEVLDPGGDFGVSLIDDSELLIARDALKRDIAVDTAGAVQ